MFAACLLGIASRPAGYSAAIWPANAVLLGLLLRNPSWARGPTAWICALAGYLTADMLTGAPWLRALGMNGANLLGVAAGWLFFRPYAASIVGFTRQRAVLTLLAGSSVAALGSALPATPVMQWAFASQAWTDMLMWLSSEMYNLLLFLPLVLAAPGAGSGSGTGRGCCDRCGRQVWRPCWPCWPARPWPTLSTGPACWALRCPRWCGAPWPTGCSPSRC